MELPVTERESTKVRDPESSAQPEVPTPESRHSRPSQRGTKRSHGAECKACPFTPITGKYNSHALLNAEYRQHEVRSQELKHLDQFTSSLPTPHHHCTSR